MENKMCSKCGEIKSLENFLFKNKNTKTYHSACKECWKEIRKKSYNKNKKTTLNRNKRLKQKNKDWYVNYKSKLICEKCGETHPACLDFHHKNSFEKEFEISVLIRSTYSINKIKKEINKCIILCSNCHRKLHYDEKHKNEKKSYNL